MYAGVYGAFLLAIYNSEAEEYQTISKIGTGFSEEQLKTLSDDLGQHVIQGARPYYRCALQQRYATICNVLRVYCRCSVPQMHTAGIPHMQYTAHAYCKHSTYAACYSCILQM